MIYPEPILPDEIIGILRKDSAAAAVEGLLSPAQLQLIYREKWFQLFVPSEYGGLALSLPQAVRLEENIAYADGSVGWVVTLCAGAAMFIGYFNEGLAEEIFTDPYVCLAGSGSTNGSAKMVPDGFKINGEWPYASGAPHATHFTANCVIEGSDMVRTFVFKREEVTLHHSWQYIGLHATAGYSFSVVNLMIPAKRGFTIDPLFARLPGAVYLYPFLQLAETTLAGNISGMCWYFFELAKDILHKKRPANGRSEAVKNKGLQFVSSGMATIEQLRKEFYHALDTSWSSQLTHGNITTPELEAVSQTSKQLAQEARNLVNLLYPYCGLEAARTDSAINQVWRNINTASQHTLLL